MTERVRIHVGRKLGVMNSTSDSNGAFPTGPHWTYMCLHGMLGERPGEKGQAWKAEKRGLVGSSETCLGHTGLGSVPLLSL